MFWLFSLFVRFLHGQKSLFYVGTQFWEHLKIHPIFARNLYNSFPLRESLFEIIFSEKSHAFPATSPAVDWPNYHPRCWNLAYASQTTHWGSCNTWDGKNTPSTRIFIDSNEKGTNKVPLIRKRLRWAASVWSYFQTWQKLRLYIQRCGLLIFGGNGQFHTM